MMPRHMSDSLAIELGAQPRALDKSRFVVLGTMMFLQYAVWGAWGFLSKVASAEVNVYLNQLLYTVGLAPLMVFVAWTVHQRREQIPPRDARRGASCVTFL